MCAASHHPGGKPGFWYSVAMKLRSRPSPALALLLLIPLTPLPADAKPWWLQGADVNQQDFLPPEVAFRVAAHLDGDRLRVNWVIADGYYLYRSRITVQAESADQQLADLTMPAGTRYDDAYFGAQEIYRQQVQVTARVLRTDFGAHPVTIKVSYQGCAMAGLCYPPIAQVLLPSQDEPAWRARPASVPQRTAILGGVVGFLLAGLWLRRQRQPGPPAR